MKGIYLIILFICIGFVSCAQNKKQKCINDFNTDIRSYADSSSHYFDIGLSLIDQEVSPMMVTDSIGEKVKYFEKKMNDRVKKFRDEAEEVNLSTEQYRQTIEQLNGLVEPAMIKYRKLRDLGVF